MRFSWAVFFVLVACGSSHGPSVERDAGGGPGVDAGRDVDAGFTVPAGRAYSEVRCDDRGTTFFAEIWPTVDGAECAPPPDIAGELLILGIDRWDGAAGTFVVGEATSRGTARAGTGGLVEARTGTITIEPFTTAPEVLSWNLDIGSGRADLRACGRFEMYPCGPAPTCEPPPGGMLSPSEVANRLSRLLWDDEPDIILGEAASSGALSTGEGVEAEAQRMIADGRSDGGIGRLVRTWLAIDGPVETTTVPAAIVADLPFETSRFAAQLVRDGGDRRELLLASWSVRNGDLSRWYGASPTTEEWARVDLATEARRGALMHGSVMLWHGTPSDRGVVIRSRLLCQEVPPHPPGVDATIDPDPSRTRREQWGEAMSDPSCAACHQLIDPLGFAFEHFDANGAYRATDNGFPIDPSGEIVSTDVDGAFADAEELLARLSVSDDVRRCIVTKWFEHALGHAPDECSWQRAYDRFRASGDDLRALLLAIAASPSFRAP